MMSTATPDRTRIITEALRKIDDLSARLQIAEQPAPNRSRWWGWGVGFRVG